MKKSNIIDLALKLFGIYVVIAALLYLKDLHFIKSMFTQNIPDYMDFVGLGLFLAGGVITFIIGYLLIFKSSRVAKKICKEDFDINLAIDPNYSKILEISLVIFGLYILIFHFPYVISSISQIISHLTRDFPQEKASLIYSICSLFQYLFGYLLVTNSKAIAAWIIRINKKNFGEVEN
ncbi:hypothetical protein [Labilibaculum antarcticum]|uniref:Uncharacterized protein n=1 Tax=Labilibaculum antarcticum TaxID=1717717 RepID=A0A1Y1CNS7_9BACT|nr:hypothetical protein [Labilibaculum antarcticum]BAX82015.1 hypothetical protein ALGA_3723 [Labilibaculum antarcticum]